jgi:hypothetical protein
MLENFRWWTLESFQRDVADILNVLHSFQSRVETAGSQISELGEEPGRGFELTLRRGDVANVIANLLPLGFGKLGKFLFEPRF